MSETSSDIFDPTREHAPGSTKRHAAPACQDIFPSHIGRYTVLGRIGRGGFADVLLARDDQLHRQVALKLPRRDRFQNESQLQAFINEARTAARLQHPGIVTVFDVGYEGETPYIVLEYIRGRSLADLLDHESLSPLAAAQLVAAVAEALDHAHEQGFVHCDIKPQNILLDTNDRPHLADFGLAVRHRDQLNVSNDMAGTTHYMSPEQIRGENHRIDGRTDLWALGVVFYRILTGRLPCAGASVQEVFQKTLYTDPVAPRQIDATIPSELERICLRCLWRQMSGRYRTATELASELLEWIRFTTGGTDSSLNSRRPHIVPPDAPVVPRGLRSFTQDDCDFFLKLIPGPRDRDGLPTPIRFWKNALEEREPEETFNVGLLYGPSGCGKSSLFKAGVMPHLTSAVTTLFVEATPHDTEARIARLLRRMFTNLPVELDLADGVRELREQSSLRCGQKVLLVLDQFERWLHDWHAGGDAELVRALRQCDGGNVQCVLLVRDDFWLPVSRFMRQLELGIVDGTNAMLVDSFTLEHARFVLRELGVAHKRLPENEAVQSALQTAFIEQATADLAQDNRLYPVQLAVFVEMVKDRQWTPETLGEMGGIQGVGVEFLESSVGSRASPARRAHEQAARAVLAALLPHAGQINASGRTRSELFEASKYTSRQDDFEELMHLLDVELRLLTPTRSAEDESRVLASGDPSTFTSNADQVYQLTHDFLVPSIRQWLECHLRETRVGRAYLLLQEQAELWNSRPSHRLLPSLLEFVGLWFQTHHRQWTSPQKRMMRAASRRLLRQSCIAFSVLCVGTFVGALAYHGIQRQSASSYAGVLFSKLLDVSAQDVPAVVREMTGYREWIDPWLDKLASDESQPVRNRVRAALARLPTSAGLVDWLVEQLVSEQLPPGDFGVILNALANHSEGCDELLRRKLADVSLTPRVRFRIACALARFDDTSELWSGLSREIADSLLQEPTAYSSLWIETLKPVAKQLREPVRIGLVNARSLEAARNGVQALYEFSEKRVDELIEVLADAQAPHYRAIVEQLRLNRDEALPQVRQRANEADGEAPPGSDPHAVARGRANLVVACFELNDRSLLNEASKLAADPRLRTELVLAMTPDRVDLNQLLPLIMEDHRDQPVLNVALSAAWHHLNSPLSDDLHDRLANRLLEMYESLPNAEIHSVTGLLLRKLGIDLTEVDRKLAALPLDSSRDWFVNKAGQTMIVLRPAEFRLDGYTPPEELKYSFAIAATETRHDHFREFFANGTRWKPDPTGAQDVPASDVLAFEAAKYCNWLSQRDGIADDQWCYPPEAELTTKNCWPVEGFESKLGYRLPLNDEWEFACRAGSTTSRFYGEDLALMRFFGWSNVDFSVTAWPVARLLPNAFGLFDMYGNISEICLASRQERSFVSCGGNTILDPRRIDSASTSKREPQSVSAYVGFRVVRLMRD